MLMFDRKKKCNLYFLMVCVVNKGFIHVVNDHIHEPNNLLNRNE